VRDEAVHRAVVTRVTAFAANQGWPAQDVIDSPILGADGNKEFLALFKRERP
jgi:23S rRNA (cytidine1920-2'-O)/16S rRNA (cytidine1409-2'-O)-methyltransferase